MPDLRREAGDRSPIHRLSCTNPTTLGITMTRKARHTESNRRGVPLFLESGVLRLRLVRVAAAVLFGVGIVSQAVLVTGFEFGVPTASSFSPTARQPFDPFAPTHSAPPSIPVPEFAGGAPASEFADPLPAPGPSHGGTAPSSPNAAESSAASPVLANAGGSAQQAAAPSRQQRGHSDSAPGATNRPTSNPHN